MNSNSDSFYSGATERIQRFMIVLGTALTGVAWWRFGWRIALGFVCGCVISYLNFHWLKKVVTALADRATLSGETQSSKGVVFRFMLRYFLIAVGAYVILSVSPASLYGLLMGLFLVVGAIACEAAYEAYASLARGL